MNGVWHSFTLSYRKNCCQQGKSSVPSTTLWFLEMIAHSLRSRSMGLWIHFSLHMSEQKHLNHKGRKYEFLRSTLEDRSKWFWETWCTGTEQNKLILTHDFAGFLVVKFLIPVQHSQKRKWGQQHQTDSQEHVTRKGRKVNPLEEQEGGLIFTLLKCGYSELVSLICCGISWNIF